MKNLNILFVICIGLLLIMSCNENNGPVSTGSAEIQALETGNDGEVIAGDPDLSKYSLVFRDGSGVLCCFTGITDKVFESTRFFESKGDFYLANMKDVCSMTYDSSSKSLTLQYIMNGGMVDFVITYHGSMVSDGFFEGATVQCLKMMPAFDYIPEPSFESRPTYAEFRVIKGHLPGMLEPVESVYWH